MVNVLVVEDIEDMREMLRSLIDEMEGVRVIGAAANIWEARLEVDRRRPDLVLLDEILPGESSYDFLTEVTQNGVPCLLMTGVEESEHPLPKEAVGRIYKPGWNSYEEDRVRIEKAIADALL